MNKKGHQTSLITHHSIHGRDELMLGTPLRSALPSVLASIVMTAKAIALSPQPVHMEGNS